MAQKFTTVDGLKEKCDAYFAECDSNDPRKPYTLVGLAFSVGFPTMSAFKRYMRDRSPEIDPQRDDPYYKILCRARMRIEVQRSEQLLDTGGNVVGRIFDLKCNFGWCEEEKSSQDSGEGAIPLQIAALPPPIDDIAKWLKWFELVSIQVVADREKNAKAIDVSPGQSTVINAAQTSQDSIQPHPQLPPEGFLLP